MIHTLRTNIRILRINVLQHNMPTAILVVRRCTRILSNHPEARHLTRAKPGSCARDLQLIGNASALAACLHVPTPNTLPPGCRTADLTSPCTAFSPRRPSTPSRRRSRTTTFRPAETQTRRQAPTRLKHTPPPRVASSRFFSRSRALSMSASASSMTSSSVTTLTGLRVSVEVFG